MPSVSPKGPYRWSDYDSNLDAIIHDDGLTVNTRSDGAFAYLWSGIRGERGVKSGKWYFEARVLENTPVDMPDTTKRNQNVMRVGWSEATTALTLGEVPGSFGYGGTGKGVVNRTYPNYGKPYSEGDTIGCYIDLDSRPMTVSCSRNGEFFGVMAKIPRNMEGMGFFPHVFIKNVKITAWFGDGPKPKWGCKKDFGYTPIAQSERPDIVLPPHKAPTSKSECELVMMIGLPATGKTSWAHKYVAKSGKRFDVLSTDLILDQMRVYNMRRKGNFKERFDRCMKMASAAFAQQVQIAKRKKRNYVLDQTNVFTRARSKKISNFTEYHKIAAVCVPSMEDYEYRKAQCAKKNKVVPENVVNSMIKNFELPTRTEFDDIIYTDEKRDEAEAILRSLKDNCRGGGRGGGYGGGRQNNRNRDRDYDRDSRYNNGRNQGYGGNRYGGGNRNGGGYGRRNNRW